MERSGFQSSRIAIVVIGRNEGDRLIGCLSSLKGSGCVVAYVDSGSTDESTRRAEPFCQHILELDLTRALSAARARNEGFAMVTEAHPDVSFVQFIDGDCTLLPGWLASAWEAMQEDPLRAIVVGPLEERRPEASIYNRLCALEWRSPLGDLSNFGALGGIMFVRASAFARLRGFNEQVIAGEDSDLGVRASQAGFKVNKIAQPMATHDADIQRFSQWWRRAVRSGHAIGQRFSLHGSGPVRDCARERRSLLFWGFALPAAILLLTLPTRGLSFLLASGYLVLWHRIAGYRRAQGDSIADARLYARFVIIGKFAEALGFIRFQFNRLLGRYRIIEYK